MDNLCGYEQQDHFLIKALTSFVKANVDKVKKDRQKSKEAEKKMISSLDEIVKAQAISDAGGYLTLTPSQKSLINMPDYIQAQVNKQAVESGSGVAADLHKVALSIAEKIKKAKPIPATSAQVTASVMTYLPFIVIGAVIIFFIIRKR